MARVALKFNLLLSFPKKYINNALFFRSSIVNNRTQAVVCDDLGIPAFAASAQSAKRKNKQAIAREKNLKTKDRADLLEAYLGALYVDKDLEYCK